MASEYTLDNKNSLDYFINLPLLQDTEKSVRIKEEDRIFFECNRLLFKKYLSKNLRGKLKVGEVYKLFLLEVVEDSLNIDPCLKGIRIELISYEGAEDRYNGTVAKVTEVTKNFIEKPKTRFKRVRHLPVSGYGTTWFILPKDTRVSISE